MKNLLIIGAGGFAREVYWHAQNSLGYGDTWIIKGFLDGDVRLPEERYALLDAPVLGDVEHYEVQVHDLFVCAIADVRAKQFLTQIIERKNGKFLNLIHHTAMVSGRACLGTGIILCPFTLLSCNTRIGNHVMVNSYSSVGHDASLGDYTSLMSHVDITGNVQVGKSTYWGTGARVLPQRNIGDFSLVGAGSMVLRNLAYGEKVAGVPAKSI